MNKLIKLNTYILEDYYQSIRYIAAYVFDRYIIIKNNTVFLTKLICAKILRAVIVILEVLIMYSIMRRINYRLLRPLKTSIFKFDKPIRP